MKLQKELDNKLKLLKSREGNARRLVEFMYGQPVFNAAMVEKDLGLSVATIYKLLDTFEKTDIITEFTGAKRGRVFIFDKYMKLF